MTETPLEKSDLNCFKRILSTFPSKTFQYISYQIFPVFPPDCFPERQKNSMKFGQNRKLRSYQLIYVKESGYESLESRK